MDSVSVELWMHLEVAKHSKSSVESHSAVSRAQQAATITHNSTDVY